MKRSRSTDTDTMVSSSQVEMMTLRRNMNVVELFSTRRLKDLSILPQYSHKTWKTFNTSRPLREHQQSDVYMKSKGVAFVEEEEAEEALKMRRL